MHSNTPPPVPITKRSDAALPDTVLGDLLLRHAAQRPMACALHFEGQPLSYGDLARQIEPCAAWLWHRCGVRAGDRVAYLGYNHADQITLLFALAYLGAVQVPLNYRLAPSEWQALLQDCQPVLLLHDEAWAEPAMRLAAGVALPCHPVEAWRHRPPQPAPPRMGTPTSPVLLVYTSGTTGTPKGAVHTQANLMANMRIAADVQSLFATDVIATVLPLFHVGGLCIQTLPALWAGASVILHARFDAGAVLDCLRQHRPSLTLQVPATLRALVAHPAWPSTDLSCLRAVWAGSSLLPQDLVLALHQRGVPVCNVYGATETGPFSIALGPKHAFSHVGSCGWPAPGVEVRLQAVAQARPADEGLVGEICLKAPNVVSHYWPATPSCDADGWFHTGDLATRAADGSYRIVGRAKDMVISGGENIYPAEVENALSTHPAVAECAVLGLPDARWGEVLVAAVVLQPGAHASDEDLIAHLAERIARYKLPRQLLRVEALPKTALGKVQKAVLLQILNKNDLFRQ